MNIDKIPKSAGKEIEIKGWVWRKRESKNVIFILLRDSHGIAQFVVKDDQPFFEDAQKLTIESSVIMKGIVHEDKRSPTGYEIKTTGIGIVQIAERYPITKDQSTEFLLDVRHLWIRSRKLTTIMKIRSTVVGAMHEFFRERGYIEFDPPIFTPNACEGGSTLFEVKYFDKKMYLTQSWQLYAEAAIFALEKIYDVAPTFRAEKSKTSRHLAEFWMAEMEAAWMKLDEVIQVAKDEIKFIIKKVLEKHRKDLEFLGRDISKLEVCLEKEFPTITYSEASFLKKRRE